LCVYPLSFSPLPRTPTTSLFPYTTLFRSLGLAHRLPDQLDDAPAPSLFPLPRKHRHSHLLAELPELLPRRRPVHVRRDETRRLRSEEHTSELQSRFDLVCRLLLEKKNIDT